MPPAWPPSPHTYHPPSCYDYRSATLCPSTPQGLVYNKLWFTVNSVDRLNAAQSVTVAFGSGGVPGINTVVTDSRKWIVGAIGGGAPELCSRPHNQGQVLRLGVGLSNQGQVLRLGVGPHNQGQVLRLGVGLNKHG